MDQCIEDQGVAEVYAQVFEDQKRINIIDVVKSTMDIAMKSVKEDDLDPVVVMNEKDNLTANGDQRKDQPILW